ncbi:5'-nucleotidase C-terminal domain-containing protein [Cognatishimia maritima]|uniref:2',3'-cyclic-nucleotide 2'-phosphodiesterase / 3'-nucleotidase n=1 Tax=Cognatishimia maritima TaxID=870908 RepID=A0A1M5RIL3_9RHOB|nr:5'-nucleotidase C-terminal domain-containing protein [Cognatishimia maritima]SHH26137.1 2',3'-cyclic-nucleotide 2'-phosphodiesterase / 3'-nucleotidase [Cognatishimia maritima]
MTQPADAPSIDAQLHILATSDVHGALVPGAKSNAQGALSGLSALITRLRSEHTNCLLLDNGDFLQGGAICDYAKDHAMDDHLEHPVISAMNHLRYDAVGLGNHEFDFGLPYLNDCLRAANFPVIGSNIVCPKQAWQSHIILQRTLRLADGTDKAIRIGVMSLLPEQVTAWNACHLAGRATTEDIVDCARATARALRTDGADFVVCLLHSGFGNRHSSPKMENAAFPVAEQADIDAMICGHTHRTFPDASLVRTDPMHASGRVFGVPTVMPGFDAAFLGQITLDLSFQDRTPKIIGAQSELLSASPTQHDNALIQLLAPSLGNSQRRLATVIGQTDVPIHSYFSRLPGDVAVAVTAAAQLRYAKRHLAAHLPPDQPILSAASPFKGGGRGGPLNFAHISAGPVTKALMNSLHPFQNQLVALDLTGAQLTEWLEMSASNFHQVLPNQADAPLRNADFPCYSFDTIFGLHYDIDITQPARFDVLGQKVSHSARVKNLRFEGRPISETQRFVLLTNSYRAGGGGNFPGVADIPQMTLPMVDSRSILQEFLKDGVTKAQIPTSPWRFSSPQCLRAIAAIGPGVRDLFSAGESPEIPVTEGPIDDAGFLRCAIEIAPTVRPEALAFAERPAYIDD